MVALSSSTAGARDIAAAAGAALQDSPTALSTAVSDEPVMFCIHDAQLGEVSILHGSNEVIVRDRQLVARILNVAGSTKA